MSKHRSSGYGGTVQRGNTSDRSSVEVTRPVTAPLPPRRRTRSPSALPLRSVAALGFLASVLVVVGGALAGASGAGSSGRLWTVPAVPLRPSFSLLPALFAYFGGLIVLIRAWLLLRRYHLAHGLSALAAAAVIVIWSIPLVAGPPLGSRDVYAYAAQGRMADQGLDVYEEGPVELGVDDPVLAAVDPLYWESPVLYGPVFVSLSSTVASATGDHLVAAVFAFRLMAVLGLLVTAFAVWDLARQLGRDPVDSLILAVANPLVLFHLVSGAHNEAIMLGFLVSGVAIGLRRRLVHVGIMLCAVAAAIKLPAILAVAFLGWPWALMAPTRPRRLARAALAGLEALAVIAVAGQLTGWGWGWVDALVNSRPVNAYLSVTRVFGGGFSLLTGLNPDEVLTVARLSGVVLALAVTTLLLLRRHQSWPTALAWSLLLWAVFHPTTQPWYLTWGIVLLAATTGGERNRAFIVGCAMALFAVLPIGPQLGLVVLDNSSLTQLVLAALALTIFTLSPRPGHKPRFRRDLDPDTVSVVVPTRHEAANIEPFVQRLTDAVATSPRLVDRRVEVLYVDDSDDETPEVIAAVAERDWSGGTVPISVRLVHRPRHERWGGLGGAVVDGFIVARGAVAVVMDGDLQHPAERIADLVAAINDRPTDGEVPRPGLVVASRRIPGGSDHEGLTATRRRLSMSVAWLAQALFPKRIGRISDPLSGFFAVDLRRVDLDRLYPDGFKILVELLATHPELTTTETPFQFIGRRQGMSKASISEGGRFIGHLLDVRLRTTRPWGGASVSQRLSDQTGRAIASN